MARDLKYGTVQLQHTPASMDANEIVVVFRAQDKLLVPLLARYENLYVQTQPDGFNPDKDEFVQGIRSASAAVLDQQREMGDRVKLPD